MYTLRIVPNGEAYGVSNTYLGNYYVVAQKFVPRENDGKQMAVVDDESKTGVLSAFEVMFKKYYGIHDDAPIDGELADLWHDTYCFVDTKERELPIPIKGSDSAYVMTERGSTFEKLN